jgi:hypothetical protein
MKTLCQSLLLTLGALALAGTASAQVPAGTWTGNDTSDVNFNTGMGYGALGGPAPSNGGCCNTASGYAALYSNTTGVSNTASGYFALKYNTTGSYNTASGESALYSNTTADYNTASGVNALYSNTTGNDNTASGYNALYRNKTGLQNTASGSDALYANTTGDSNTASGYGALYHNTTGKYNIALGWEAGYNLTTGSNNIDIGNQGVAADAAFIKIGTEGTQTETFIAGISGVGVSGGVPVVVGTGGQLGIASSSERFKTAITPMGSSTQKLDQLRPVMFQYKSDPQGAMQYGLIAEEVAQVYPELVVHDHEGRILSVRYDELAPMLLNELQQQRAQMTAKFDAQAKANAAQASEIRDLKRQVAELNDLKQEMRAALRELKSKEQFVANR